jgi:putative phage-type endonuclease
MKVQDFPQGSPEWLAARVGLVTASRVSDIIAKTKTGVSASRANYLGELVAERLTGVSAASDFMNDDMRRGVELEPDARFEYEAMFGKVVQTVGLVLHPTLQAGASPDGLVDDDGLIEIKCPRTHVHIECLESRKPPAKYLPQMAWQCICTGRQWCDFVSYDPKMPERLRLFAARFIPEAGYMRELEAEVTAFIAEVDAKVEALSKLAA